MLTLAGLEDPSKAPSFQSVVLDQIKHLRKQLDEDEQAALMGKGQRPESDYEGGYEGDSMDPEDFKGRKGRYLSQVIGNDGLPQMILQGDGKEVSPLIMKVKE